MTGKGALRRIRGMFSRSKDGESPAQTEAPTGEPAEKGQSEERRLAEVLEQQSGQLDEIIVQLHAMGRSAETLIEAVRAAPAAPAENPSLAAFAERSEELIGELQRLTVAGERQLEVLEGLRAELACDRKQQADSAAALSRLAESIDDLNRSNVTHVDVMEQIRDRMVGSNDEFAEMLSQHGRRFSRLLIGVIVAVLILAGALVLHRMLP